LTIGHQRRKGKRACRLSPGIFIVAKTCSRIQPFRLAWERGSLQAPVSKSSTIQGEGGGHNSTMDVSKRPRFC
jgi:hypothetical protein